MSFIWISAVVLLINAASVASSSYSYTTTSDTNCNANEIAMYTGTNQAQCAAYCDAATNCVGYIWDSADNLCWPKSGWGACSTRTNFNRAVKGSAVTYTTTSDTNCNANEIAMYLGTTQAQCAAYCNLASNCVGYIYDSGDSLCWPKSGWGACSTRTNFTRAVKG